MCSSVSNLPTAKDPSRPREGGALELFESEVLGNQLQGNSGSDFCWSHPVSYSLGTKGHQDSLSSAVTGAYSRIDFSMFHFPSN